MVRKHPPPLGIQCHLPVATALAFRYLVSVIDLPTADVTAMDIVLDTYSELAWTMRKRHPRPVLDRANEDMDLL
jgi:hypothetical protein